MSYFHTLTGHACVMGDERAESLTSKATIAGGRAMDQTDILNAFRDSTQIEYSDCKLDSVSLPQLLEDCKLDSISLAQLFERRNIGSCDGQMAYVELVISY